MPANTSSLLRPTRLTVSTWQPAAQDTVQLVLTCHSCHCGGRRPRPACRPSQPAPPSQASRQLDPSVQRVRPGVPTHLKDDTPARRNLDRGRPELDKQAVDRVGLKVGHVGGLVVAAGKVVAVAGIGRVDGPKRGAQPACENRRDVSAKAGVVELRQMCLPLHSGTGSPAVPV
jgi:hypothetical protein